MLGTLPDFLISCCRARGPDGRLRSGAHLEHRLPARSSSCSRWSPRSASSLWLSALNVLYRDVQYIIPFLVQLWMFLSPVIYPMSKIEHVPGWVQVIYNLNPMTGVIGGFRWALFGRAGARSTLLGLGRRRAGRPGGRPLLLPAHGARLRRRGVTDERLAISISGLGKRYKIGAVAGRSRDPARRDHERRGGACAPPAPRRVVDGTRQHALGAPRRQLRRRGGAGHRHHRPQRRRQEHAAQDPLAHHRAHDGRGAHPRPRRQPARGGHRVPPGAHRAREHLPERRDPGHDARRDRPQVRRASSSFSEIGEFLDTPVKRYSSGMFVRLAFAVAAHLEPEILLVDEVLAVGDLSFQRKCLGQMERDRRLGPHGLLREPQHERRPQPVHPLRPDRRRPPCGRRPDRGRGARLHRPADVRVGRAAGPDATPRQGRRAPHHRAARARPAGQGGRAVPQQGRAHRRDRRPGLSRQPGLPGRVRPGLRQRSGVPHAGTRTATRSTGRSCRSVSRRCAAPCRQVCSTRAATASSRRPTSIEATGSSTATTRSGSRSSRTIPNRRSSGCGAPVRSLPCSSGSRLRPSGLRLRLLR